MSESNEEILNRRIANATSMEEIRELAKLYLLAEGVIERQNEGRDGENVVAESHEIRKQAMAESVLIYRATDDDGFGT